MLGLISERNRLRRRILLNVDERLKLDVRGGQAEARRTGRRRFCQAKTSPDLIRGGHRFASRKRVIKSAETRSEFDRNRKGSRPP